MKPNKFFEQKKKEKQVIANKGWKLSPTEYHDKMLQEAKNKERDEIARLKGKKNGRCNRSACLSSHNVIFFNRGTGLYYCDRCSMRINEFHEENPLCKTDEGQTPGEWRRERHAKEIEDFKKRIEGED